MGGRHRVGVAAASALAAILAPAPATAAPSARTVSADAPAKRTCQERLLPAGTRGAAPTSYASRAAGFATVRLAGSAGDWDLAVFDARTGRLRGAGATFGARETAVVPAERGGRLVAQACRRTGFGRTARVAFDLHPVAVRGSPPEPASLVSVRLGGGRTAAGLEALGLDVTHDVDASRATVVLYSAAERTRLAAAGYAWDVLIADMRAEDRRRARADRLYSRSVTKSALPSARDGYRTLADYGTDLKSIVDAYPAIARRIEIGRSIEDRPIEGVELATGVGRADDGRPTYAVLGLHHAREWPSGEMPMELALDLAKRYRSDARVRALLDRVRVVVIPVMNPDGFEVSRTAGPTAFDDDPNSTLPLIVSDGASYKRKNCRPTAGSEDTPCITRPAGQGVDLNRNYGAYWGGVGSSDNPAVQNYRGAAPFSEPESEAFHRLSSTRQIVTVISHHTFTAEGVWLRQPGFCFTQPCSADDVVPDEAGMRALGDSMGRATGWASELGWDIGEITGATEDWNYFTQGAYGYTPEQRGPNFHPSFQSAVVAEYLGTAPGASGGVREALLRAGEQAANAGQHSLLMGTAPAGRVLRLSRAFETPTELGPPVQDRLAFELRVPDTGFYLWHVNRSTRPLSPRRESYTLTCERPGGAVLETRQVAIGLGQSLNLDLACGGPSPRTRPALAAAPAGVPCSDLRAPRSPPTGRLARLSRTRVRLTGRASDPGCSGAGATASRRGRVARVLVAVARLENGRCRFLKPTRRLGAPRSCRSPLYLAARGTTRWALGVRARLPRGAYRVWTRAVDASGNAERTKRRPLRLRVR